jgi:phage shock protein PspC (stress-responsive transcriptional regulator)
MDYKRIKGPGVSVLGGVLAGLAYKTNIPAWVLRTIVVILSCFIFFPVLVYLVVWMFAPSTTMYEINGANNLNNDNFSQEKDVEYNEPLNLNDLDSKEKFKNDD